MRRVRLNLTQPTFGTSTADHFRDSFTTRRACPPTMWNPSHTPALRQIGLSCVPGNFHAAYLVSLSRYRVALPSASTVVHSRW